MLRALLGGVFAHHPAQCPVTVEPLLGHPLTAGAAPFTLVDEHYMMDMDDSQTEVFLTAHWSMARSPPAGRAPRARCRVAVLTPGHNLRSGWNLLIRR